MVALLPLLLPLHLLLPLLLLVTVTDVLHAEVWVGVENRLENCHNSSLSLSLMGVKHIIGVSSSSPPGSLYVTALDPRGPSVYRMEGAGGVPLLLARDTAGTSSYYEDLAVDKETAVVYVTSRSSGSILQVREDREGGQVLPFLSEGRPSGVAIHPCSRRLFWTNSDRSRPSISSVQLPSNMSRALVTSSLTRPRAIAVSTTSLYWSDTRRGRYRIETSGLEGEDRRVLVEGALQEPFSLAVSGPWLYWTDWTSHSVWRAARQGGAPELVTSFPNSRPHGVASLFSALPAPCPSEQPSSSQAPGPSSMGPPIKGASSEGPPATRPSSEGPGDTGPSTEGPSATGPSSMGPPVTSTWASVDDEDEEGEAGGLCQNYCLGSGVCSLQEGGLPVCRCREGRTGARCEEAPCHNYCLGEGAVCLVLEGAPECLCTEGREGDRCQVLLLLQEKPPAPPLPVLLLGLASSTGLLLLLVLGLAATVCRLRRRPRVRKRFISTPKAPPEGTAPASQQCGGAGDGVSLDIENCCNMTLCDTPCFEPPTRGPKKSSRSRTRAAGRLDRRALLDNQEEEQGVDF